MKVKQFLLFILSMVLPLQLSGKEPVSKDTYIYAVKDADTLRMDRYYVADGVTRPCIVFMFGGGFAGGQRDRERYVDFFEFMVDEGFTTISIDYRLGLKNVGEQEGVKARDFLALFENAIRIAVEDLYSATNYILENASYLAIDPSMIIACGSSAGAISVLQGEYERCNRTQTARVLPEDFRYAGVISFAGAIYSDHGHLKWNGEPAPLLLIHGDADKNVPYGKIKIFRRGFFGSEYIAKRYDRNGFPYYFYAEQNVDHKLADSPMNDNREEVMSFLRKYVQEEQRLTTNTVVVPIDKPDVRKRFGIKTYIKTNFGLE